LARVDHQLDRLVGCAVSVSTLGVRVAGQDANPVRQALEGPSAERKGRPPGADERGLESGMSLLRWPTLPGNLHAPGMGSEAHPPTGVSASRQTHVPAGSQLTTWEKPIGG